MTDTGDPQQTHHQVPIPLDGWYHTIECAPGVTTRGNFDLREHCDSYGLPERMDGMRALDVGTQDGFWAFEMERRGADVIALNHPLGAGTLPPSKRVLGPVGQDGRFFLAKSMLNSQVTHVSLDITTAHPDDIGMFDFILAGAILIHVRDQALALERIAQLCRGTFVSVEFYDRIWSAAHFRGSRYRGGGPIKHRTRRNTIVGGPYWWCPAAQTWTEMIRTAGFQEVERMGRCTIRSTSGVKFHQVVHRARP